MSAPRVVLVGMKPNAVGLGVILTDGSDQYRITDEHKRVDGWWYELENVQFPENRQWFRLIDMVELAFAEDPDKDRRVGRYGVRRPM